MDRCFVKLKTGVRLLFCSGLWTILLGMGSWAAENSAIFAAGKLKFDFPKCWIGEPGTDTLTIRDPSKKISIIVSKLETPDFAGVRSMVKERVSREVSGIDWENEDLDLLEGMPVLSLKGRAQVGSDEIFAVAFQSPSGMVLCYSHVTDGLARIKDENGFYNFEQILVIIQRVRLIGNIDRERVLEK